MNTTPRMGEGINKQTRHPVQLGPGFPTLYAPQTAVRNDISVNNHSLVLRWDHQIDPTDGFYVKAYYDFTKRNNKEAVFLDEERTTFDLDFRHWTEWNAYNTFIWGASVRTTKDKLGFTDNVAMTTDERRDTTWGAFIQNTTFFTEKFSVMLGSKIEANSYTGMEVQPSVRMTYIYSEDTTF